MGFAGRSIAGATILMLLANLRQRTRQSHTRHRRDGATLPIRMLLSKLPGLRHRLRFLALVALLTTVAAVPGGCWQEATVIGPLTVWNRANVDVTITSPGTEHRLGPCESATWPDFSIRPRFEIWDDTGTIGAILAADTGDTRTPGAFFVVVTADGATYASVDPPNDLPVCET